MEIIKIVKAGFDFIIPVLDKLDAADLEKRLKTARDKLPAYTQTQCERFGHVWYENVKAFSESEDERRNNIDARLQPILGLIPVGTSVLLGVIGILLSQALSKYTTLSISVLYFGGMYITLQLVFAFFYAIKGLSLRLYEETRDLFPEGDETINEFRVRFTKQLFLDTVYNAEKNNDKASYLKCVHVSLRNAFVGMVLVILVLIGIGVYRYIFD